MATKAKTADKLEVRATECLNEHIAAVKAGSAQLGAITAPIHALAVEAKTADEFKRVCKVAETAYKAANKVTNLRDTLELWIIYKSTILACLKEKIPLGKSYSEARKRLQTARKAAAKKKAEAGETGSTGSRTSKIKLQPSLTAALEQLAKDCTGLTLGQQDVLAVWIAANMSRDALDKIAPVEKTDAPPASIAANG